MSEGQTTTIDVPQHVLDYLQDHQTLTLATASPSGLPHASTYLYVSDGPTLYFWSHPTTTTARQIQQNPIVSFTVDDYSEDLSRTRGIQAIGKCSVVLSGEQIARVADMFGQKFPKLAPGSTMSISFFRITPTELQFIDNTAKATEPQGTGASREGAFGAEFHRERTYSVIAELPPQRVDRIVTSLQSMTAPAGETIVRQGTPADKFLILVEGEAEVIEEADGETRSVASLTAGDLFGEIAIMRDHPRAATVRATIDSKLLGLERDTFRDLVAESLEITRDFDELLRSRVDTPGAD